MVRVRIADIKRETQERGDLFNQQSQLPSLTRSYTHLYARAFVPSQFLPDL